jgi:hypothetical protein
LSNGRALAHGAATLTDQPNDGVAASGTGGGLSYVVSGITAYSIQLSTYFSAISGTATITAWKGTNTGSTGIQLGSTTTGVTSPAISLNLTPMGNLTTPATITVTITMANGSSGSLFTIESLGYTKQYDIQVTLIQINSELIIVPALKICYLCCPKQPKGRRRYINCAASIELIIFLEPSAKNRYSSLS